MPIRVSIPVRLRVDPSTALAHRSQLGTALAAAAGRALGAAQAVTATRGGYLTPYLHDPEFTWTGEGLGQLAPETIHALEADVRRILAETLNAAGLKRPSGQGSAPLREPPVERLDRDRWDETTQRYSLPTYQDRGRAQKVPARPQRPSTQTSAVANLRTFTDLEEVYAAILEYYPNPAPRGDTFYGVYGRWNQTPTLFWIAGMIEEGVYRGRPQISSQVLISGALENGRFIPSANNTPMSVVVGQRYRMTGLLTPRQKENVPYQVVLQAEAGGTERAVFFSDELSQRLRGRVIRFGVPEEIPVVLVTAPALPTTPAAPRGPRRDPPWLWHWRGLSLPAEPEAGFSEELWLWYGWMCVRPESMRADPLVREVFESWVRTRRALNILFIPWIAFYKAYCQRVARDMLRESRRNMTETMGDIDTHGESWRRRFAGLVRWMAPSARFSEDARLLDFLRSRRAGMARDLVEQQTRGPLPGGVVLQSELDALDQRIAAAESQGRDAADMLALMEAATPLLKLLSLSNGREGSLDTAIRTFAEQLDVNPDGGAAIITHLRRELLWLVRATTQGEQEITRDEDIAAKLAFVREVANSQLAPWFTEVTWFKGVIDRWQAGSVIEWIGLGIGLVVLMFVFPPAGAVAAAGVGVASAASSIAEAMQMYQLNRVRLAQYHFRPLASDEEFTSAVLQAVMDVGFAILDLKALGEVTVTALRAAARRGAGAMALAMEEGLRGLRQFDQWPRELVEQLDHRVTTLLDSARPNWRAGLTVEQIAEELARQRLGVQREVLVLYEKRLLEVQQKLERHIAEGTLSPAELRDWLTRELPPPRAFVEQTLEQELRQNTDLFRRTLGATAGTTPAGGVVVEFLALTREELQVLTRDLGGLAPLLTPQRLMALRQQAGLTEWTYRELALHLKPIMERVENPSAFLERLEILLNRQQNSSSLLHALTDVANPRRPLELLTEEALTVRLPGGHREVFQALERTPASGTVQRLLVDVDARMERRLLREISLPNGQRTYQMWDGLGRGWVEAPHVRIADPIPGLTPLGPLGESARDAALARLDQLAGARTPGGRLSEPAQRVRDSLLVIRSSSQGRPILNTLAAVADRYGDEVARELLDSLGYFLREEVTGRELSGIADFLNRGGDPRVLNGLLGAGAQANRRMQRNSVRRFLDLVPQLGERELGGVAVVFRERGGGFAAAEAIMAIPERYPGNAGAVFAALNDLAPHSDGLGYVIGYLRSLEQNLNQAALAQLFAARRLLDQYPGKRLAFEAVEGSGGVVREIDIRVVSPITRVAILDVEIKEISRLFYLERAHAQTQLARDIIRSTRAAQAGERPLGRIRWLVRKSELLQLRDAQGALRWNSEADLLAEIRSLMSGVFNHSEMLALTAAQRTAAQNDFLTNFQLVFELF